MCNKTAHLRHREGLSEGDRDEHPRVRLEAIVAASWLDNEDAVRIIFEALKLPLDSWMGPVTKYILDYTLADDVKRMRTHTQEFAGNSAAQAFFAGTFKFPELPKSEAQQIFGPTRKFVDEDMRVYNIGKEVYLRDAHCATCHQVDGKGLGGIYPPLERSDWLGDEERLIKLVLKGLWGPIEVNGQHFDPSKGVPPMMGFGGMLNDNELAAVLTYVRQSFGNNYDPVSSDAVRRVRAATEGRVNFYMVDELLKEHPMPTTRPAPRPNN